MKRGAFIKTGLLAAGVVAIPNWAKADIFRTSQTHLIVSLNGGLRSNELSAQTAMVSMPNSLHHVRGEWIQTTLMNPTNTHVAAAQLAKKYAQQLHIATGLAEMHEINHAHMSESESFGKKVKQSYPQREVTGLLNRDAAKWRFVQKEVLASNTPQQWTIHLNASDLAHTSAVLYKQSLEQLDEAVSLVIADLQEQGRKGTIHLLVPVLRNNEPNDSEGFDHNEVVVEMTACLIHF